MKTVLLRFMLFVCIVLPAGVSQALTIEIQKGNSDAIPIAVVPFGWTGPKKVPLDVGEIIATDLRRSGYFSPLPKGDLVARPVDAAQVRFENWRALKVENLIVGRMEALPNRQYRIQFQLLDVFNGTQLAGYSIQSSLRDLRRAAHQISDLIFEKLTGVHGAFDTRLAYVTVVKGKHGKPRYRLAISDIDGYNEQIILESGNSILSPAWAPDGSRIAYVSVTPKGPVIHVQNIHTGRSRKLRVFRGLNNAPAWSPDGRKLAVTLSKDGNAEIYVYDLASNTVSRVTRNYAIDTEAAWLPDGKGIIFTSDRGGTPQLYRILFDNAGRPGRAERLTFDGKYNARAAVSPDGKQVAFVNDHRIAVMDLETFRVRVLSETSWDESPSFAPNGSMIIYATQSGRGGVLAAVSVEGRATQKFSVSRGDIREPAWSPFRQRNYQ
ncbi:MAG TPA: Tol-Pal system beta propeller repeat protein TolB [Gammaproteobacteria bacterium]|nr:Tol-Pal system beta propeller repeat protein TolB [Gammaproteobacteria bacterium]